MEHLIEAPKVEDIIYHGTEGKFDTFEIPYGESYERAAVNPIGVYFAEDKEIAQLWGKYVKEVVKPDKIFDATKIKTVGEFLDKTGTQLDINPFSPIQRDTTFDWLEAQDALIERLGSDLVDKLKSKGYEAIRFNDKTRQKKHITIAIFDVDKIVEKKQPYLIGKKELPPELAPKFTETEHLI